MLTRISSFARHPAMPSPSDPGPPSTLIQWFALLTAQAQDRAGGLPEELRHAQAVFRSLVDSLPLHLLIKDSGGRRIFANLSYLTLHQKKIEDILGKTD